MDRPNEELAGKIFISLLGVAAGLLAAWRRIMRPINGTPKPHSAVAYIEAEVMPVLKRMREDIERNKDSIRDQYLDLLRRVRQHDDDLEDIKLRLKHLEK
jgi:hypothetical protein